ncbi:SEC-C domain-containing protein [Bacillus sp. UNC41MFS5]|uniref:SEC-C domain-containing protein n=1 Tax=Bacillus sp. UNC41MFS5 TaxID=1449046 RepID=UPI00047AD121|nr:SEC-C domain-containing protein [Bacillus sp. UNC41MFS5]
MNTTFDYFLTKARQNNGFPIVDKIDPWYVQLSDGVLFDIFQKVFMEQTNNNELLANSMSHQIITRGYLTGQVTENTRLIDLDAYHPFIDEHNGIVLAKLDTLVEASIDLLGKRKSIPLRMGISKVFKHFIPDIEIQDTFEQDECFCGSGKGYDSCCKEYIELSRIHDGVPANSFFGGFYSMIADGEQDDSRIAAQYLYDIYGYLAALHSLKGYPLNRLSFINEMAYEAILFIPTTFSYEKLRTDVLPVFLKSLEYAGDLKHSYRKMNRNWEETISQCRSMLEQEADPFYSKAFSGLEEKTIERLQSLQVSYKALNDSGLTDYSLLTLGMVTVLEKELNEVRALISNDSTIKPLMLGDILSYFKRVKDEEVKEKILPLIYALRQIREKEFDEFIRKTRNEIAHGNVSDNSHREYETIVKLCTGSIGLFKAISVAKMSLRNQVVLDKDQILFNFFVL